MTRHVCRVKHDHTNNPTPERKNLWKVVAKLVQTREWLSLGLPRGAIAASQLVGALVGPLEIARRIVVPGFEKWFAITHFVGP